MQANEAKRCVDDYALPDLFTYPSTYLCAAITHGLLCCTAFHSTPTPTPLRSHSFHPEDSSCPRWKRLRTRCTLSTASLAGCPTRATSFDWPRQIDWSVGDGPRRSSGRITTSTIINNECYACWCCCSTIRPIPRTLQCYRYVEYYRCYPYPSPTPSTLFPTINKKPRASFSVCPVSTSTAFSRVH